MNEQHKRELDQIHAPKALVEQTKQKMRLQLEEQERKVKMKSIMQQFSLVAVLLVICSGAFVHYQNGRTQIIVQEIPQPFHSLNPNLGSRANEKQVKGKFSVERSLKKEVVPTYLWEGLPSKINGKEVFIGKDKNETYYAGFRNGKTYYFLKGENSTETEFIDDIKKFLDEL